MRSTTEYIAEAKEYAINRLARLKEKFGDNYIKCDDETALWLLQDGYLDGIMRGEYKTETNLKPEPESKIDLQFFTGWPNITNCRHNCRICQGKCLYRKEPYKEN